MMNTTEENQPMMRLLTVHKSIAFNQRCHSLLRRMVEIINDSPIDNADSLNQLCPIVEELKVLKNAKGDPLHFGAAYIESFFHHLKHGAYVMRCKPDIQILIQQPSLKNVIFIDEDKVFYADDRLAVIQAINAESFDEEIADDILNFVHGTVAREGANKPCFIPEKSIKDFLVGTILVPNLKALSRGGLDFKEDFKHNDVNINFINFAIEHSSLVLICFFIDSLNLQINPAAALHPLIFAHRQLAATLNSFGCMMYQSKVEPIKIVLNFRELFENRDGLIAYKKDLFYYDFINHKLLRCSAHESPLFKELLAKFSTKQLTYTLLKKAQSDSKFPNLFSERLFDQSNQASLFNVLLVLEGNTLKYIDALSNKAGTVNFENYSPDNTKSRIEFDQDYDKLLSIAQTMTQNEDSLRIEDPEIIQLINKLTGIAPFTKFLADQETQHMISRLLGIEHCYYNDNAKPQLTCWGEPIEASLRTVQLKERLSLWQTIILYLESATIDFSPEGDSPLAIAITQEDSFLFNKYQRHWLVNFTSGISERLINGIILDNNFHIEVKDNEFYLGFCHISGGYQLVHINHPELSAFIATQRHQLAIDFKLHHEARGWMMEFIKSANGFDFSDEADVNSQISSDRLGFTPLMRAVLSPGHVERKQDVLRTLNLKNNRHQSNHQNQTLYHLIFGCKDIYSLTQPSVSKTKYWINYFLFSEDYQLSKTEFRAAMTKADDTGLFPLDYAINFDQDLFVLKILKDDPSLALELNDKGETLLFACMRKNNLILFNKLLELYPIPLDGLKAYAAQQDKPDFMERLRTLEGPNFDINTPTDNLPAFSAQGFMLEWFILDEQFNLRAKNAKGESYLYHLVAQQQSELIRLYDLFDKAPELLFEYPSPVDLWFELRKPIELQSEMEKKYEQSFLEYIFKKMAPRYEFERFKHCYQILLLCMNKKSLLKDANQLINGGETIVQLLERCAMQYHHLTAEQFLADMETYKISINVRDSKNNHILAKLIDNTAVSFQRINFLLNHFPKCQTKHLDEFKSSLLQLACLANNQYLIDALIRGKSGLTFENEILEARDDGLSALDAVLKSQNLGFSRQFWLAISSEAKLDYMDCRKNNKLIIKFLVDHAFFGWNPKIKDYPRLEGWGNALISEYLMRKKIIHDEESVPEAFVLSPKDSPIHEPLNWGRLVKAIESNDYELFRRLKDRRFENELVASFDNNPENLSRTLHQADVQPAKEWQDLIVMTLKQKKYQVFYQLIRNPYIARLMQHVWLDSASYLMQISLQVNQSGFFYGFINLSCSVHKQEAHVKALSEGLLKHRRGLLYLAESTHIGLVYGLLNYSAFSEIAHDNNNELLRLAITKNNESLVEQLLRYPEVFAALGQGQCQVLTTALVCGHSYLLERLLAIPALSEHAAAIRHKVIESMIEQQNFFSLITFLDTHSVMLALQAESFFSLKPLISLYFNADPFAYAIIQRMSTDNWWTFNYLVLEGIASPILEFINVAYPLLMNYPLDIPPIDQSMYLFHPEFVNVTKTLDFGCFSELWYEGQSPTSLYPLTKFSKRSLALEVVRAGNLPMLEHLMNLDSVELYQAISPRSARFYNRLICEALDFNVEEIACFLMDRTDAKVYQLEYNNRLLRRGIKAGHTRVISKLLENNDVINLCHRLNNYVLRLAIQEGLVSLVEILLGYPNICHELSQPVYFKLYPLHLAYLSGQMAIVGLLLKVPEVIAYAARHQQLKHYVSDMIIPEVQDRYRLFTSSNKQQGVEDNISDDTTKDKVPEGGQLGSSCP